MIEGNELQAKNIMSNLLVSNISKERILLKVILPTLNIINDMYDRGKITEGEKLLIFNIALDLVAITKFVSDIESQKLRAYSISVSGSEDATYLAKITSVILHSIGWHSLYLGNVEHKIDPFFDIDIQRLIIKRLTNINGIVIALIFSFDENTFKFLYNTINTLKTRITGDLKIALCTNNDLLKVSQEMEVDYATTELNLLIDWVKEEYNKIAY